MQDYARFQINETLFDRLLRKMRLARVLPSIKEFSNPRLLDIGCGFEAKLLRAVEDYVAKGVGIDYKAPEIRTQKLSTFSYIFESKQELGLEASKFLMGGGQIKSSSNITESSHAANLTIDSVMNHSGVYTDDITPQTCTIFAESKNCTLPFENESFEIVTMLAVIEHLHYPIDMLAEIERVLVPNGIALLTAPSHLAKPVLEFLSYKLHLIDECEIRDHKRYYNKADFTQSIALVPNLKIIQHKYFQCGMNNFVKVRKGNYT